jgi:hypothetical protein
MATTASLALVAWSAASVKAHSGVAELDLCPQSVPKRGWGKYDAGSVRGPAPLIDVAPLPWPLIASDVTGVSQDLRRVARMSPTAGPRGTPKSAGTFRIRHKPSTTATHLDALCPAVILLRTRIAGIGGISRCELAAHNWQRTVSDGYSSRYNDRSQPSGTLRS